MRAVRSNGRAGGSSTASYGGSHARAAGRDWTTEVSLFSSTATPSWSEEDQATTVSGGAAYATSVLARVQALAAGADQVAELAGEDVAVPRYLVAVDFGQDAAVGDLVRVDVCPEDEALETRTLRVDHVVLGPDRFQRDLLCTLQEAR